MVKSRNIKRNEVVINKSDSLWMIRYYPDPEEGNLKSSLAESKREALEIAMEIKKSSPHIKKLTVL